jgi:hypothetical protein
MFKERREELEAISRYTDPKHANKAWKQVIGKALEAPGKPLPAIVDKYEQKTVASLIEEQAYSNVKSRLESEGLSREPMQVELLVEANIIRARHDSSTFNILLDRSAGKVKDELVISKNAFEELSDDDLEAIAKARELKNKTS